MDNILELMPSVVFDKSAINRNIRSLKWALLLEKKKAPGDIDLTYISHLQNEIMRLNDLNRPMCYAINCDKL